MAGKTGQSGGAREGAGRKSKADELQLAETIDQALGENWVADLFKVIHDKAKAGSYHHQQLLLAYRVGKPKETVDISGALTINLTRKVVK